MDQMGGIHRSASFMHRRRRSARARPNDASGPPHGRPHDARQCPRQSISHNQRTADRAVCARQGGCGARRVPLAARSASGRGDGSFAAPPEARRALQGVDTGEPNPGPFDLQRVTVDDQGAALHYARPHACNGRQQQGKCERARQVSMLKGHLATYNRQRPDWSHRIPAKPISRFMRGTWGHGAGTDPPESPSSSKGRPASARCLGDELRME